MADTRLVVDVALVLLHQQHRLGLVQFRADVPACVLVATQFTVVSVMDVYRRSSVHCISLEMMRIRFARAVDVVHHVADAVYRQVPVPGYCRWPAPQPRCVSLSGCTCAGLRNSECSLSPVGRQVCHAAGCVPSPRQWARMFGINVEDFPLVAGSSAEYQQYRAVLQRRRRNSRTI